MPTIKTAISIEKTLFEKGEALAHKTNLSRSQLYAQALEYMIAKDDSLTLVKELNKAYGAGPTNEERLYTRTASRNISRIIDKW